MRLVSICLLVFLYASVAHGQRKFRCPATPKKENIAIKKAGRFFSEGERLAQKEKYKRAIDRYLCSLKMKEHSNTMFNIAQISKLMEDKEPAVTLLKKFRKQNPEHPSLAEIDQLIERMELGDSAINPVDTQPEEHKMANAVASGPPKEVFATPQENIEVLNGPPEGGPPRNNPSKKLKVSGIALIATGGVLTVIGIGTNVGASRARDDAKAAANYSDYSAYDSKYKRLTAGSVLSYVFGVASITVGAVLILRSKKISAAKKTDLTITPFQPGMTLSF